ncbi:MAG: hypothetical protein PHP70_06585 [Gallionella sp.]|nr:hypothetical protein [Gallionella sp.]
MMLPVSLIEGAPSGHARTAATSAVHKKGGIDSAKHAAKDNENKEKDRVIQSGIRDAQQNMRVNHSRRLRSSHIHFHGTDNPPMIASRLVMRHLSENASAAFVELSQISRQLTPLPPSFRTNKKSL